MNVASLELSRELYLLSGWRDDTYKLHLMHEPPEGASQADIESGKFYFTYFTLGYLLRKLQGTADREWSNGWLYVEFKFGWDAIDKNWMASWKNTDTDDGDWFEATGRYGSQIDAIAETPEDALCKLAIELFKQGILEKQQ